MKKRIYLPIMTGLVALFMIFGASLTVTHQLQNQPVAASGNLFWLIWVAKNLAVLATMLIPMLLPIYPITKRPSNYFAGILLLFVGAILFSWNHFTVLTNAHSTEFYLLKGGKFIWLSFVLLIFVMPAVLNFLKKVPLKFLRRGLLIWTILFIADKLLFPHGLIAINPVSNILWVLYLFALGYWLQHEPWIAKISMKFVSLCLVVSILIAIPASWFTMNRVHYDTHHGMTNTLHYLTAINLDQPMLVLTAVCIVALIMKRLARFELDGQVQIATYLFWGISLQLVTVPKVMLTLLGGDTSPSAAHLVISSIVMVLVIFILSKALTLFSNRKFSAYFFKNLVRQLTIKSWRVWALGGVFWLLTLVSMSKLWNFDINMTQWLFLHREPAIIVNVLIVLAVFGVLYAFINRFWIATTLTFSAYVVWLIASFVKIADRAEPILPVDTLFLITAPEELTSMVSTPLLIAGVIGIVLLVFLGIFFQKKDRGLKNNGWLHRLIILVFSAGLLGSFTVANQASLPVHSFLLNQVGDRPYFYSQLRGAKLNGTLLQFANNIDVTTMKKPAGYSKAKIEAVEKKYQKAAAKLNKTRSNSNLADQTVIFVLSESFADPTTTPNLKVNKDPIPYIHSLENSTTSGKMLSSGYGGGTANMEYQTLTGLAINNFSPTLPTPYSQLVPYQDQAVAFTDLFDYKVGIHPFSANLYSRKKVYEKFGFDQFYHLKGGDELSFTEKIQDSPYISDESAYNQTVQVINQHAGGQFINLVTMQNHMPYDDYYQYDDFSVSGTAYTDDAHKKQIENYIQGLHYTDQALKKFITELDSIDKPITMVWYGDHYPGIYDGNSMDQVGIQMHATDYFIYSNKKARKNSETLDKTKLVSPNNFSAMALAQMDQQVSPYYALLTKVYENLPAMSLDSMGTNTNNTVNSSSEFVNESGKVVKLNKKQRQLLADYKLIQYDLTAGKNYAINARFMPESRSQKE